MKEIYIKYGDKNYVTQAKSPQISIFITCKKMIWSMTLCWEDEKTKTWKAFIKVTVRNLDGNNEVVMLKLLVSQDLG